MIYGVGVKALIAIAAALCICLTACSSSGPSKSTLLGQYDGQHRISVSAQEASPGVITHACEHRFALYLETAKLQSQINAHPTSLHQKQITPTVSTPSFTIDTLKVNVKQYLAGCRSALTHKLDR